MDAAAWAPHGAALRDYLNGDTGAEVVVRDENGEAECVPAQVFFRGPGEFSALEDVALDLCGGRVLDVGAGAGSHSLALQDRGLSVVALDLAEEAVEVMRRRGVHDAHRGDIFSWDGEEFDTLLLLMNGVGVVGTLEGLDRFLQVAQRLLAPADRSCWTRTICGMWSRPGGPRTRRRTPAVGTSARCGSSSNMPESAARSIRGCSWIIPRSPPGPHRRDFSAKASGTKRRVIIWPDSLAPNRPGETERQPRYERP